MLTDIGRALDVTDFSIGGRAESVSIVLLDSFQRVYTIDTSPKDIVTGRILETHRQAGVVHAVGVRADPKLSHCFAISQNMRDAQFDVTRSLNDPVSLPERLGSLLCPVRVAIAPSIATDFLSFLDDPILGDDYCDLEISCSDNHIKIPKILANFVPILSSLLGNTHTEAAIELPHMDSGHLISMITDAIEKKYAVQANQEYDYREFSVVVPSDLEIHVGGDVFAIHKYVAVSRCEYFASQLSLRWQV